MEEDVGDTILSSNLHDIDDSSTFSLSLLTTNIITEDVTSPKPPLQVNELLQNGILVETKKGVEWMSLTDALTSGVGGLNLSVEDFQNVSHFLIASPPTPPSSVSSLSDSASAYPRIINPQKLECILETCESSSLDEGDADVELVSTETEVVDSPLPPPFPSTSSSLTATSESNNSDSSIYSNKPPTQGKRKGGWPKGRKRKPEVEHRPPKAPSTGYVLYLNEKRKLYKELPFPEVTKLLGNEWTKLSPPEKKVYLDKAEIDKKRYREELKVYRKSDAYQSYLRRKRVKSLQANGTEESDIATDATDEIDEEEEDNDVLYCRVCDQWFTTLHNKREHLNGRQHFQAVEQSGLLADNDSAVNSGLSLDESSLDGVPSSLAPTTNNVITSPPPPLTMDDNIASVVRTMIEQNKEIQLLRSKMKSLQEKRLKLKKEYAQLKQKESNLCRSLQKNMLSTKETEKSIRSIWSVPALYLPAE
uniref:High mobility group protein 20A n=1 Tax=Cacopsylla melanoneura TaxID=428564 RepID=A0A8D8LQD9_9HEMI